MGNHFLNQKHALFGRLRSCLQKMSDQRAENLKVLLDWKNRKNDPGDGSEGSKGENAIIDADLANSAFEGLTPKDIRNGFIALSGFENYMSSNAAHISKITN